MGLTHAPKIVTDGMTLCLDPGNIRSYPKTGTDYTNLGGVGNAALYNGVTFENDSPRTFNFDGSNDYISVDSATSIMSSTAYTKVAWFNASAYRYNIISSVNSGHAFWLGGTNRLRAGHNNSWGIVVSTTTIDLNTWYCGAVTFNTTTGWVLYLDGEQEATNSNTGSFSASALYIGAHNAAQNLFQGKISTCLIYNRVLSPEEIRQNYNALRWRFNK